MPMYDANLVEVGSLLLWQTCPSCRFGLSYSDIKILVLIIMGHATSAYQTLIAVVSSEVRFGMVSLCNH
jgi:hypothetical protein